jgi:hypothetical protein
MWCWRRMEKISWIDHVRKEGFFFKKKIHNGYFKCRQIGVYVHWRGNIIILFKSLNAYVYSMWGSERYFSIFPKMDTPLKRLNQGVCFIRLDYYTWNSVMIGRPSCVRAYCLFTWPR